LVERRPRFRETAFVAAANGMASAFRMATRIALLAEKHIVFFGTPEEMAASENEYIRDFLGGF